MNRREFLQSLAAIGTALAIDPSALAGATEAEIASAWTAVSMQPETFFVARCGALATTPGHDYPYSRGELYGIDVGAGGAEELIALAREHWQIDKVIWEQCEAAISPPEADWEPWLRAADEDTLTTVAMAVRRWLDDMGAEDYEYADLNGKSSRGEAMSFFRDQHETADMFQIAIVEGCHPGSTYYAAELRMDIAAANQLAAAHGIPIRFAHDEDWV